MRQCTLPHKVLGQEKNAKGSVQRMVHVAASAMTTRSNNVDKQRIARRATAVTRLWQCVATTVALDTTETVTTTMFIALACYCRWVLICRSMSSSTHTHSALPPLPLLPRSTLHLVVVVFSNIISLIPQHTVGRCCRCCHSLFDVSLVIPLWSLMSHSLSPCIGT